MNISIHRLLMRQLGRTYGKSFDPDQFSEQERQLIEQVSATYEDTDRERKFYEHILELNSAELNEKNRVLKDVLRSLAEAQRLSKIGSWMLDLGSQKLEWSEELYRIIEMQGHETPPAFDVLREFIHPEDLAVADIDLTRTLEEQHFSQTYRLVLPSGAHIVVHEQREVFKQGNVAIAVHGTMQDVTAQKLSEQELHLYADVFHNSGEAILITDSDAQIMAVNSAFTRISGYIIDDLLGKKLSVLSADDATRQAYVDMCQALMKEGFWQGELTDRRKDGSTYPKWITISASRDEHGNITNYVASFTDITETKAAQQRVHFLAHHDALTGLLNRFSFEERLIQSLNAAGRNREHVALLFIDMDRFKIINDTLGHQAGDALLIEVGRRLSTHVRDSDIVARIGGDEFVVVLTELTDDHLAAPIARILLHALGEPYALNSQEVYSSPSIGISIFPTDGGDAESLMRNADTAMYHAKALGRNNYQFYTESLNASANERLRLETELRSAIAAQQFELFYQPKVCRNTGGLAGFEALLRWRHPERGLVGPDQFIPILEETKLIVQVGNWVLEEACRQHVEWRTKYNQRINIAVNLSAQQLRQEGLVEQIRVLLEKYQIATSDLELEITESVAMENPEQAVILLHKIRDLGVILAIDDFGTGYSSLAYLKLLPIQLLKLDRSFVRDIETDRDNAEISAATISLAHNLGLKVVAEGVETEFQSNFLINHQCDFLQGYLYGKPSPAKELATLIETLSGTGCTQTGC